MNYNNDKIYCNKYNYGTGFNNRVFLSETEVPINRSTGFIEVYVFTQRGQFAIPGALITVYARNDNNNVQVYNTSSQSYPITIGLPIANPSGTLIRGPQYYFTTYDITVEHESFAPYRINNIRLFENTTMRLDCNLVSLIQGQFPVPETIINIPPHPRDAISGQSYKHSNLIF